MVVVVLMLLALLLSKSNERRISGCLTSFTF
jgi:hypothetical protein